MSFLQEKSALDDYFGLFGKIEKIHVPVRAFSSPDSFKEAYVTMENAEDVRKVLATKNHVLMDHFIKVRPVSLKINDIIQDPEGHRRETHIPKGTRALPSKAEVSTSSEEQVRVNPQHLSKEGTEESKHRSTGAEGRGWTTDFHPHQSRGSRGQDTTLRRDTLIRQDFVPLKGYLGTHTGG